MDVDLAALDTGIGLRNRHMRENHLETDRFPQAVFRGARILKPGRPPLFGRRQRGRRGGRARPARGRETPDLPRRAVPVTGRRADDRRRFPGAPVGSRDPASRVPDHEAGRRTARQPAPGSPTRWRRCAMTPRLPFAILAAAGLALLGCADEGAVLPLPGGGDELLYARDIQPCGTAAARAATRRRHGRPRPHRRQQPRRPGGRAGHGARPIA
ncbi:MAG: YceI family protein [bacterium]|nr:YceI family protein [bacterium]